VRRVRAAVELLDGGATVPFIARYRKEATGSLDDTQLRFLQDRLRYLRELEERREVVLRTISEQGKLTPELEAAIKATDTKVALEDLYLPTGPSGGPRPRSPERPDWSLWPTRSCRTPRSRLKNRRPLT